MEMQENGLSGEMKLP